MTTPPRTPPNDPSLVGIGGWLILVALWQIMVPRRFSGYLREYYEAMEPGLTDEYPIAFAGEAILYAAAETLFISTAILFFRKSRHFPRFFVYSIFANVFVLFLSTAWIALALSLATGQSFATLFQADVDSLEIMRAIVQGIVGCILILYIYKSRRVANTFVR